MDSVRSAVTLSGSKTKGLKLSTVRTRSGFYGSSDKLPECVPEYSITKVVVWFFLFGQLFILVGVVIIKEDEKLFFLEIDYTANSCLPIEDGSGYGTCQKYLMDNYGGVCQCEVRFELSKSIPKPVYIYYELTKFYQNHRLYTQSQDHQQLLGIPRDPTTISTKCLPFSLSFNKIVVPCGTLANSMFNDTISLWYYYGSDFIGVPLKRTNISWATEKGRKYKNPPNFHEDPTADFLDTARPVNWQKFIYELDPSDPSNNGFENEDFIVWMKPSAFPKVRKLHRIVDHIDAFENVLPNGSFVFRINYTYPTRSFGGKKKLIIATVGWLGGKNPFLGYFAIVVGIIFDVMICLLLIICNRSLKAMALM